MLLYLKLYRGRLRNIYQDEECIFFIKILSGNLLQGFDKNIEGFL